MLKSTFKRNVILLLQISVRITFCDISDSSIPPSNSEGIITMIDESPLIKRLPLIPPYC